MANPLYGAMGGGKPTLQQVLAQVKANPMQMLARKYNIPQGVNVKDPDSILDYLVKSGQVSQQQYNAARQKAEMLGFRK